MLDDFALEVDRQRLGRIDRDRSNECRDPLWTERYRQKTVNEAILEEDRSETGSDDGPDAAADQPHDGECLQASETEVLSRDQNRGIAVGRLVEDELGVLCSVRTVAQS